MTLRWQTDADLRVVSLSPDLRALLGIPTQEAPLPLEHIVGEDSLYNYGVISHQWALQGEHVTYEHCWDNIIHVLDIDPLYAPSGDVIGVSASARPLTEKLAVMHRETMREAAETISAMGTWYFDARTAQYDWSPGLFQLIGLNPQIPLSRNIRTYDHADEQATIAAGIARAQADRVPYAIDHRLVRIDGSIIHVQEKAQAFFDDEGLLSHVVGTLVDITSRKSSESRLTYLAYHDALCELPNRSLLEERFDEALQRAVEQSSYCGVLFIDVNGFKAINDTYGHRVGDEILRAVAARLRRHIRANDTVARIGGDEFAVVLDTLKSVEDADAVAQTIHAVFDHPITVDGRAISVSASIGAAVAPPDGTKLQSMLAAADAAMYRNKRLAQISAVVSL